MYGGNGLQFNISHTAAVPQQVKDAFQVAANQWSALLTDDILVNVTVDYTPTAAGFLIKYRPVAVSRDTDVYGQLLPNPVDNRDAPGLLADVSPIGAPRLVSFRDGFMYLKGQDGKFSVMEKSKFFGF